MQNTIRELKEAIERKQALINNARTGDIDVLREELADMQVALRLLEINFSAGR